MVIVWRLGGTIIRTALCWIVWRNVYSQQHTYMSSSYGSNRLGLSHWDLYAVHRGGCLKLYDCNMVEWFWWDSSMISTTNWFPSVLWHRWFGHLAVKFVPKMTYNVSSGMLSLYSTVDKPRAYSYYRYARNCCSVLSGIFANRSLHPMPSQYKMVILCWAAIKLTLQSVWRIFR